MAKGTSTKSTANVATVDETTVATDIAVEENMNVKENTVKSKPLMDSDEIEVVSLIPNVSYKDGHTGDFYSWEKTDHVESMTFETLKNMWRNSKGYFRNMWLKPLDSRVINKFGLESTYAKYEFLMDEKNYTRKNIEKICENISATPNGMKLSICNKIKDWVINGKVTDVVVIRSLEKHFDLDLVSFLG